MINKTRINSEDVKINDIIDTWFGEKRILKIEPYIGPFDFILNVFVFDNGTKMSNEKGMSYMGYML
jgi:hypothetical protein